MSKIIHLFFLVLTVVFLSLFATHPVQAATPEELPFSYFDVSSGQTLMIVNGPDENLWFTIDRTGARGTANGTVLKPVVGSIGRITPQGVVTEFPLPENTYRYIPGQVDSASFTITSGHDNNLWFTQAEANKIGKITPQGTVTEYSLPQRDMWPRSITSGPDSNIWFVIAGDEGSMIISMNTQGEIKKEISIPGYIYGTALTFGPDGNLWFRGANNGLGKVTPSGVYTEYHTNGSPVDIIPGIYNDLWAGLNGGSLTRITTDGSITEYPTIGDLAWAIAKGPDNTIWFKELFKRIRKIDSDGANMTLYTLSGPGQYAPANDMVFGPDGNIWFTGSNNIGRIEIPVLAPSPTPTHSPEPTTSVPAPGNNEYNNNYNNEFNNNYINEFNNGFNNNYNNGYNNNYNNGYNNGFNNGFNNGYIASYV